MSSMKRIWYFSGRVTKEILRDPINLFFGLGFPLVLLCLLSAIQKNIPVELFVIEQLTPGVAAFGLSFMTLFSATLIAKDRSGAFLQRLYTSPMRAADYILGYSLPLLPIAMAQGAICYLGAWLFGLPMTVSVLWAILLEIPAAIFFIALGLLCGSLFNDKQVGGLCGALLTNLTAFLSGAWFDVSMVGGAFEAVAECLPFLHATELGRALLAGAYVEALPHLYWVTGYALVTLFAAVPVFTRKMRE